MPSFPDWWMMGNSRGLPELRESRVYFAVWMLLLLKMSQKVFPPKETPRRNTLCSERHFPLGWVSGTSLPVSAVGGQQNSHAEIAGPGAFTLPKEWRTRMSNREPSSSQALARPKRHGFLSILFHLFAGFTATFVHLHLEDTPSPEDKGLLVLHHDRQVKEF